MASVIETETIGNLVINRMTKEIYQELKDNGQVNPYEMYLITGDERKVSRYTYTTTLSFDGWSSSAPYTQTVVIDGILATDNPHITPIYSKDWTISTIQIKTWPNVTYAIATDGGITFTAVNEKPYTIEVLVEVFR